ncbi:MAG: membrane protein insertion efficiency factor YidD [Holosporales bacterium]|jgi:putative membrane protein insertion efficiency factor|nr:membrane protein insertion efficiency factor YidD [Holosporales bacterium]
MKAVVIKMIKIYQFLFSNIFAGKCRFQPSCSKYAIYAIEIHGLVKGIILTIKRLIRCRASAKSLEKSAGKYWGYDPVSTNTTANSAFGSKINNKK